MAVTGEEYVNYYEDLDMSKSSFLNLASDPTFSSMQSKRVFSTFRLANSEDVIPFE
ncbi:MAG: hypothetical protein KA436_11945 [Oligoflexales bacterium]|nr:hypothetical protein [Oligoflexales bacterium]